MKKYLTLLLLIIVSASPIFSQNADSIIRKKDSVLKAMLTDECYCDLPGRCPTRNKVKYFYTGKQYITNYSMNRLIRRDITKITSDDEGLPVVGNYASVKVSDDNSKVTLNASIFNPFIKKDTLDNYPMRSILSINVKAGMSDGVTSLFTNKNVNNQAGIKMKLSLMSKRTLYQNDSSLDCAQMKLYRERLSYELDDTRTRYLVDSSVYKQKYEEYKLSIPKMRADADALKNERDRLRKLAVPTDPTEKEKHLLNVKTISARADSVSLKHLDALKAYGEFQSKKPVYDRKKILDEFYEKLLQIETANAKWHRFKIQWWDIDAAFNGYKYNLFNKTVRVDSQLSKKSFTQWAAGISFNSFSSKPSVPFLKYGMFIKLSYLLANDNSLTGASTKEVRTTVLVDTPNFRREVISKVDAYDIPFITSFSHTFKSQFTKYLNEKKTSALSFYSTWVFGFNKMKNLVSITGKPVISSGAGYMIGFLDKAKEKNIINVELFLNFNDILNKAKDKNSNFLQRHQLGLKFGVPFNSIFLNQK